MSIDDIKKPKRGRPPVDTTAVMVRMPRDTLAKLDAYRAKLNPEPSRPEAIRRILDANLGSREQ